MRYCAACGMAEMFTELVDAYEKLGFTSNMSDDTLECVDDYECYRRAQMNMR